MADPRERRAGQNPDIIYKQIPDRVETALTGRAGKAQAATGRLIGQVNAHPFLDPYFTVIALAQRILLDRKDSRTIQQGKNFLGWFIRDCGGGVRRVNLNPQVQQALSEIRRNDSALQRRYPHIYSALPANYIRVASEYVPYMEAVARSGAPYMEVTFAIRSKPGDDIEKRETQRKAWADWEKKLNAYLKQNVNVMKDPLLRDDLVDLLREEPLNEANPEGKIFTRKHAELSLADIDALSYPLSEEDFFRVTEFIIESLEKHPSSHTGIIFSDLFGSPATFNTHLENYVYRNHRLLVRINSWQAQFVNRLIDNYGDRSEEVMRRLLAIAPDPMARLFVASLAFYYSTHAAELDPDFTGDFSDLSKYPLMQEALRHNAEHDISGNPFLYVDEVSERYFINRLLPRIEQRLRGMGLWEKYQEGSAAIREVTNEYTFSREHLVVLRELFMRQCGEEFLKKLDIHGDEVRQVTQLVWESIFEQGMHFLPMHHGLNIVDFSKNSVPDVLGLSDIKVITIQNGNLWRVHVAFGMQNAHMDILGELDQNGALILKAPLEREIPGLYTMLNHIGVLVFHDLVVQDRKEGKKHPNGPRSEREPGRPIIHPRNRTDGGRLPRRQSDEHLINDVHTRTEFTRRIVELHRTRLPGSYAYVQAISEFEQAVESGATGDELDLKKAAIDSARKKLYKPSDIKRATVPARFTLETIHDPVNGESRYVETWVVEHTSPKPTEEELRSPVLLFERHYKGDGSSALASLEQMKLWFIGQY